MLLARITEPLVYGSQVDDARNKAIFWTVLFVAIAGLAIFRVVRRSRGDKQDGG